MSDDADKNSRNKGSRVDYLGWGGFLVVITKVFAITAAVVLILKYIFRLPLF